MLNSIDFYEKVSICFGVSDDGKAKGIPCQLNYKYGGS
jgi:hypothetical protein